MGAETKSAQQQDLSRPKGRRLFFITVIILVFLGISAVFGTSAYVCWNLTHPMREKVQTTPQAAGLNYADVSFKSRDGNISLSGWLIKSPGNKKTVIFAHGYRKNRLDNNVPLLDIAQALVSNGHNVLMFDFRNSGESEGNLTSVGQFEIQDLLGAVDFIKSQPELSQCIVLHGFSMGAAVSIMAGAREPSVSAVIADSPFADLKTYLMKNLSVWTELPSFPFNQAFLAVLSPLTGLKAETVSPVKEIKDLRTRPVLLIHGQADADIPIENSESLLQADTNARLYQVPKAAHVKSFITDREGYLLEVEKFLNSF